MDERAGLRLTVLGPVRAVLDGRELDLGSAQQRATLAALLAAAGEPVGVGELVDVLWGERPPVSAVNILQRHIGTLRRTLEPGLPARSRGALIHAAGGGYRLDVGEAWCDLLAFRSLAAGAGAVEESDPLRAVDLYAQALAVRRGPVAGGIGQDARSHPMFGAVERELLAVVRRAADFALRAGTPGPVAAAVQTAAEENPLDESLQARLIAMLAATGRLTAAFEVYEQVRRRLADELGVDPGVELRTAHLALLREEEPPAAAAVAVRPLAQLPADLAVFSGRHAEVDAVLSGDTPTLLTVSGTAGVGKTTLAVHLAHRLAERFPDGQLYTNLRGFDAAPDVLAPTEALRGFLDAFGVAPEQIPVSLDAQAALYRGLLAGRRVLVLLDNARDARQVEPLLPGSPGSAVIVTSRDTLSPLVALHGARPMILGLPSPREGRELLAARLGPARIETERVVVDRIVELCSQLPLALATVAARAATEPALTLADIAADLAHHHGGLSAFTGPDAAVDVRAALSWSYRGLSPAAARLFRLLSLHPCTTGGGIGLASAAAVAGAPPAEIRDVLAELAQAQLLQRPAPGRHSFHDLLRAYAAELAAAEAPEERHRVRERILDSAVYGLHTAHRLTTDSAHPPFEVTGTSFDVIPDRDAAIAWLDTERLSLLACVQMAEREGFDEHVWKLAHLLAPYLERGGHWAEWIATQRMALNAAARLGNLDWENDSHRSLGIAAGALGLDDEAHRHLRRSAELSERIGTPESHGNALRAIAADLQRREKVAEALALTREALGKYTKDNSRGLALNEIGWYLARLGDLDGALAACEEGLRLLRKSGSQRSIAATWDSLGLVHHRLGHVDLAVAAYEKAVAIRHEYGDRHPMASSLARLALVHRDAGDVEAARDAYRRALAILTDLAHPDARDVAAALAGLGG